jgi:hypothetical protein
MEKGFWITALFTTVGLIFSTEKRNGYEYLEEDLFLPRYYRKSGKLFKLLFKQDFLRFGVYWKQTITKLNFGFYSMILLIGCIIPIGPESIYFQKYKLFLAIYFFILAFTPMIVDVVIWIYVKYKKQ